MTEKYAKSNLMFISSMLIFGTIGIFRRYIPLSSGMLAFARGLLGALFIYGYIKLKGKRLRGKIGLKKLLLLALTGAVMGINWILLFEAYNYTTVSVATLCYYMQPAIVILLSPLLFKERLTLKKLVCAALSISGMVLVSGVFEGVSLRTGDFRGIVYGLGAAAFYAFVIILNKKIQLEDAYYKTIIQLMSAAIILVPYLIVTESFNKISLKLPSFLMLLIVGIIHTGLAYVLYFGSIAVLKAQSVAILSYIDPVSALVLSGIFLRESLTFFGIIGAVLIIGSAMLSEINLKADVFVRN